MSTELSSLPEHERSLLIVDDNEPFRTRLARAMEARGFAVESAIGVRQAIEYIGTQAPAFALVDMRLDDGNGLEIVQFLKSIRPDARAVILSGYGNIASAVRSIKAGAANYLSKPADADEIEQALLSSQIERPELPENPMSADRVRWEHIQRVKSLCDDNISETARRLGMHRRTLQRILAKHSPQ